MATGNELAPHDSPLSRVNPWPFFSAYTGFAADTLLGYADLLDFENAAVAKVADPVRLPGFSQFLAGPT